MATFTNFVFYADTPFTNLSKAMHFNSNADRDRYFDTAMDKYRLLDIRTRKFNMVRDRLTVNITWDFDNGTYRGNKPSDASFMDKMMGVNYCYFYDSNSNQRFYCQVAKTEYVNDKVTRFYLIMDVITTFFQGDFSSKVGTVRIDRQHLTSKKYKDNWFTLSQGDGLRVSNPRILWQKFKKLGGGDGDHKKNENGLYQRSEDIENMIAVFQCSSDLSEDFGSVDEPKMSASKGGIYDYITSPVDIYCAYLDKAYKIFEKLSKYPWIAQNISNINIIPKEFIDLDDLEEVQSKHGLTGLKRFKNNKVNDLGSVVMSPINVKFDEVNKIISDYTGITDFLKNEEHLYNSSYIKYFVTNWCGSSMDIQPEKLDEHELEFKCKGIIGYDNKIAVYPLKYNSYGENLEDPFFEGYQIDVPRGEFIGNSIVFNSWDSIPVLIDNYRKFLASDAYDRKMSEENKLGNRIDTFMQDPLSEKGMFAGMDALGTIAGGVGNAAASGFMRGGPLGSAISATTQLGSNLMTNWRSEYDYYRGLKARQEQMKITPNTITNAAMGNAFAYRMGVYGISLKMYVAPMAELVLALRYHKAVGYRWDRYGTLDPVDSMSHVNYVQFTGDWIMDGVPAEFQRIANQLFAQGVSLYHNPDDVADPFTQDVLLNRRVK